MFERFTDRARRVVVLAQEEARCSASSARVGVAAQVLTKLGADLRVGIGPDSLDLDRQIAQVRHRWDTLRHITT
jgi:hypothetical protein